jgi:hypothetical protein
LCNTRTLHRRRNNQRNGSEFKEIGKFIHVNKILKFKCIGERERF